MFKRSVRHLVTLFLAIFGMTVVCQMAFAQTSGGAHLSREDAAEDSDGWTYRLAPYVWVTAIDGETGVKGVSADVSLSMNDVLDHLDGGIMLTFDARHGRFSINTDFIWAKLTDSSPTPRQIVFTDAEFDLSEILWTETLGYTVISEDRASLDLLAGMRLAYIDVDLDLNGAMLPSGAGVESRNFSEDETWVDPIIGARTRIQIVDAWFVNFMGDIGGFGANSTLTWQAVSLLCYEISPTSMFAVGYRALGYDHDRNGFKYDLTMHGPVLGGELRF